MINGTISLKLQKISEIQNKQLEAISFVQSDTTFLHFKENYLINIYMGL